MEAIFKMQKGRTEYPDSFAGAEIKFYSPNKPKSESDWDGLLAEIKKTAKNAETAHALYVSAYNLDRQKEIKEIAGDASIETGENDAEGKPRKRHLTIAELQEEVSDPDFIVSGRKLRGEGTGRAPSAVKQAKSELDVLRKHHAEAVTEGDTDSVAFLAKRIERVEKLMEAAKAEAAAKPAEAPAAPATPAPAPAEKPKNGGVKPKK